MRAAFLLAGFLLGAAIPNPAPPASQWQYCKIWRQGGWVKVFAEVKWDPEFPPNKTLFARDMEFRHRMAGD